MIGSGSPTDAAAERAVRALLERLTRDRMTVVDHRGTRVYGTGHGLDATVEVRSPRAWRAVALGGSAGFGRAYAHGWWHSDDPTSVVRVLVRNMAAVDRWRDRVGTPLRPVTDAFRRLRPLNSRRAKAVDRADIVAHYDLGDDFFRLFLDETMAYSCAFFERPTTALGDASRAKFDRMAQRLDLGPHDHLLEIGTGWGGFAVHAAERYGSRVTTTTISRNQYDHSRKLVADRGLTDRVTVLDADFRDLDGRYSKIASIEMLEAVDWRLYDTFFDACRRLLSPDGLLGLQVITVPDGRFHRAKNSEDFIKRHVFPGGCLPSIGALRESLVRTGGDLRITELEEYGHHYAETLRRWRHRLEARADELERLGLDERFARLWEFYLCYCEAAFTERHVGLSQLTIAGPEWRAR